MKRPCQNPSLRLSPESRKSLPGASPRLRGPRQQGSPGSPARTRTMGAPRTRHSGLEPESRGAGTWIPACAGKTKRGALQAIFVVTTGWVPGSRPAPGRWERPGLVIPALSRNPGERGRGFPACRQAACAGKGMPACAGIHRGVGGVHLANSEQLRPTFRIDKAIWLMIDCSESPAKRYFPLEVLPCHTGRF